jgi:hypothetical protein
MVSYLTVGVSEKSGTAFTKALAGIASSIPEAMSIMPLEIAKVHTQTHNIPHNRELHKHIELNLSLREY